MLLQPTTISNYTPAICRHSNVDQDFIVKAARANIRPDGRSTMQRRKIDFQFGRVNGKSRVEVCLGNTRVMATVSAELIAPFPDRVNEGFLEINSFVSPMASPLYDSGRTSDLGAHVTSVIDRGLKDTRAVDLEALCVVAGSKVWSVRCDVTVLDHDGNIVDAAMLAAIGSLLHFRKPDVSVGLQC
jgi:exosome complex component RRP45